MLQNYIIFLKLNKYIAKKNGIDPKRIEFPIEIFHFEKEGIVEIFAVVETSITVRRQASRMVGPSIGRQLRARIKRAVLDVIIVVPVEGESVAERGEGDALKIGEGDEDKIGRASCRERV